MNNNTSNQIHGTTILGVKRGNEVVLAADGQISFGPTILKSNANKLRVLDGGKFVAGFAGSTADALTLFERLEDKLKTYPDQLARGCVELAKDWRTDKYLRKLDSMLIIADSNKIFIVTGSGDVIEPKAIICANDAQGSVVAVGSGGNFAFSAAKALLENVANMELEEIAKKAMHIAADICVYSNNEIRTKKIPSND